MSSSTRATRSRYSSPAHQGAASLGVNSPLEVSKSSGNDASRSFMQRWLEPSVQNRPSYEEAGLMRYGVLEGMAPLGVPPKPKKPENGNGNASSNGHGVRKVILRTGGASKDKNAASSGTESNGDKSTTAASTGNVVAGKKRAASPGALAPVAPSRRSLPPKSASKKNDDDDEYNPGGNRRKKAARRSQAALSKTQENQDGDGEQAAPALSPDEAGLKHYPTAWALRTLYDEKSEDPEFDSMVTDVLQQTADDDTLDEFSKHIGDKKREGATENGDCYYFAPPSTATTNRRLQAQKARKPTDAQYSGLVGDSEDEEELEEPEELQSPVAEAEAGQREAEEGERRAAKKAKRAHPSSSGGRNRRLGLNGNAGQDRDGKQNAAAGMMTAESDTPSRKRRRGNSASSDSSLSSAMTLPSPEMRNKTGAATIGVTTGGGGSGGGGSGGSRGGATSGTATGTVTGAKSSTSTSTSTSTSSSSSSKPRTQKRSKPKHAQSKLTTTTTTSTSNSANDQVPSRPRTIVLSRSSAVAAAKSLSKANSIAASPEPSSPSASPTTHIHSSRARQASMPGRLAASSDLSFSHLPKSKAKSRTPADSDAPMQQNAEREGGPDEDLDAVWARRRDAQDITNNYTAAESSVRGPRQQRATTPVSTTRKTRRSVANAVAPTTRTTRSATKRPNDQIDETVSPIPFSFTGDDASTVAGSRAVTPTSQRQAKRPKGLRVKSSPVKKSGGPAGGLPRLASESQSSFRAGTPKDPATDNDEICSACGNAGDVLCCDGCPRSFHFECVNLAQSEDLPDDWYCNECLVRRFPSRIPVHRGAFASLLNNLEKSIPTAYSLPKRIQNRFEGVKAGNDGDYEEVASKTAKKKTGYDELPDLFKQRDENQPVLCHACQKPSNDTRAIIPCSVCPFYWHLDCLDPPLAVPPVLKTWRCPTHVDDVLADAPRLAPAHKFRKVRNAQPITPIFTRGTKNNGHIEIDWSDEPELLKESGWPDPLSFGRTYKVSANGVILDFIEQLRRQGAGYGARHNEQKWVPYPSPAPQQSESPGPLLGSTLGRQVDEMQASLNLIGLKQKPSDGIDQLTSALLSNADENVLRLMARGNADNIALGQLADNDKLSLRAMLAQMDAMTSRIRQVLGDDKPPSQQRVSSMPTPDPTATTPPPADDSRGVLRSSPIVPKKEEDTAPAMTTMAALREPTPPLTIDGSTMDLD